MMNVRSGSKSFGLNANSAKKEVEKEKKEEKWEMRPGGLLVQKRGPDSESAFPTTAAPIPTIRVKVKYDSVYYEIYLSSQSTFGELKKLLAERTGVHHLDQKIIYKNKERGSSAFLDICGVKDKSKLVMMVDPTAHAKRLLEVRKAAKLEEATNTIKDLRTDVDKLALQVSAMEKDISNNKKVADKEILNLIEQLMMQLIKLDGIIVDGDLKIQRGTQVRRVQKYVETLDMLKIMNEKIVTEVPKLQKPKQPSSIIVTDEWEMFDSLFAQSISTSASASTSTSTSTSADEVPNSQWELF